MRDFIEAEFFARIERLNSIGIALSAERDTDRLLEMILVGAKELTQADAGTLYSMTEDATGLRFRIVRTDSLQIAMGGTTGVAIPFPTLPLYLENGEPNLKMVAVYAALKGETINIPDAYEAEGFDFSGTRAFDQRTGYRSKSFLTIPLRNHEQEIIGVLQLINCKDAGEADGIGLFPLAGQRLAESLASQAAIILTNRKLIESLENLFEAFIRAIATAIDDKSPYTGGHCHRVPILAEMLARAVDKSRRGAYAAVSFTPEQTFEMRIAAWLHDCGKVTIPEHVVDKATKLSTIADRIELARLRFELVQKDTRDEEIRRQLDEDLVFLEACNLGGEFLSEADQARIDRIGATHWQDAQGREHPLLTEDEVYNLKISRGTLTSEEREIINSHVQATFRMLNALPFPKHLKNVPEIAGSHHESLNGKGYPRGLRAERLSLQARILAIADVFEALTAADRPYKKGKTLSQALRILGFMKKDGHIDPDLFQLFIDEEIYLNYAKEHLKPEQIDTVNREEIPGYRPVQD